MVGTYKLNGKVVSETKFKEKVYGKDSKQAQASRKRDAKKKADLDSAGSKGSSYTKTTRRDGTVEISDRSGKVVQTKTAEQVKAEQEAQKKTIVIGVGKDDTGRTKVENVGKYLTEEQRREVSRLTSEKGRLSTSGVKETQSVNAQGQTVVQRDVTFAYKEPVKQSEPVDVNAIPRNVIEEKKPSSSQVVNENKQPLAPKPQGTPYQTTRTDMGDEVDLNGIFTLESSQDTPSVMSANTPTEGKFLQRSDFEEEKSDYRQTVDEIKRKLFTQGDTEALTPKEIVYSVPAFVEGTVNVASDVVKGFVIGGVVQTVKAFTVDIDQTLQGATDLITGKTKLSDVGDVMTASLYENPAYFAGQTVFAVAGGKVIKGVIGKAKNVYVQTGSKFVEPELVFAESVLTGKEALPKASSTAESLKRFSQADDVVQTSSPAKIKGTEAGQGRKGAVGLEDTGIYVTPAGEGSPYFLRVGDDAVEYSLFGLNPVSGVKDALNIPTVTRAKTTGVEKLPRDVVKEAGFKAVQEFQESQAGSGKAFITKRSEIGQGELPRQKFTAPDDFTEGSFNIKKGDTLVEAGTSEIEAVIPSKQGFAYTPQTTVGKIKGFDYYTEFQGSKVAIRDTVLLTDDASQIFGVVDDVKPSSKTFSGESVASEQSYLTSKKSGSVTNPYALVSGVSKLKPSQVVAVGGSSLIVDQSSQSIASSPKPSYLVKTKKYSSYEIVSDPQSVVSAVSKSKASSGRSKASSYEVVSNPSSIVSSSSKVSQVSKVSSISSGGSGGSSGGSSSQIYQFVGGGSVSSPKPYKFPDSRTQRSNQGFAVFVRKKGVFQRVGKKSFSESEARDLGAFTVANSPRATFTLRPSSSPLGSVSSKVRGSFSAFKSNFLQKGGLFIEKKEKRIKSGGEKAGITRKGILANKNKGLFKGLKI